MPEFVTLVSATWRKRINKDYGHLGMQLFLTLCHNFPVRFISVWKTGRGVCLKSVKKATIKKEKG